MAELNTLPGWQCNRQIGAGSFGKVYEIQREEYNKVYKAALKVIRIPQDPSDLRRAYSEGMDRKSATNYFRSFVEDLTDEFAIMDEIKGFTNIVSYEGHWVIEHPDEIAWDILIQMELLTPLQDYCSNHTMGEEQIIRLGMDICNALEICEEKKIIHRDIKPDNIFVNSRGDFKLGDFGIARTVEKTMSGMSKKGTYDYMAPEVYFCRPYGRTVDIYSLGTMLYLYLNCKRLPFLPFGDLRQSDRTNALEQRMSGAMPQPPMHGSEQLKAVVMKSISFDAADRYQSAAEFRQALKECLPYIVYKGIEDVEPLPPEKTPGSLHLKPGSFSGPRNSGDPTPGGEYGGTQGGERLFCVLTYHGGEDGGTQGGENTAQGGTIFGDTEIGTTDSGGDNSQRDSTGPYTDGKTVYSDTNELLVNKKKHLPKQYAAIAAGIAVVVIAGGALLMRPKTPAQVPAASSVTAVAEPLTYKVQGSGGTLQTEKGHSVLSVRFEAGEEQIRITAVPDTGYKFDHWSDGYTRAEREDKPGEKNGTIYAIFAKDSASEETVTYILKYRVSGSGGVLEDAKGTQDSAFSYEVTENDDAVIVSAVAKKGYHFVEWSDGEKNETRTDKDFDENLNVAAIFEQDAKPDEPTKPVTPPISKPGSTDPKEDPSSPAPAPVPEKPAASVAENWSMSAQSMGNGQISIKIESSTAVTVKAELIFKANGLSYDMGTIGKWSTGSYTWTVTRPGPPGEYTAYFYSSTNRHMASVDVTLT